MRFNSLQVDYQQTAAALFYIANEGSFNSLQVDYQREQGLTLQETADRRFNSLQVDYQHFAQKVLLHLVYGVSIPYRQTINVSDTLREEAKRVGFQFLIGRLSTLTASSLCLVASCSFNSLQVDYQHGPVSNATINQDLFQLLIGRLSTLAVPSNIQVDVPVSIPYRQTINVLQILLPLHLLFFVSIPYRQTIN